MLYTKEFYEVMTAFEKIANKAIRMGHEGLTKAPKENWKRKDYYNDGNANEAFKIFLSGFMLGKSS